MSKFNGVNMAFCPTCRALPHEPCVDSVELSWKKVFHRARPHWGRQRIGGPRGGKRQR